MPQNWQMLLLRSNACALIFGGIILFGLPPLADCCLFESFTAWPGLAWPGGARRCKALHGVVGSARLGMALPGMARRGLVGVCGFSDFKTAFAFLVVIFYFPPSRHGVARHGQAGLRYAAQGIALEIHCFPVLLALFVFWLVGRFERFSQFGDVVSEWGDFLFHFFSNNFSHDSSGFLLILDVDEGCYSRQRNPDGECDGYGECGFHSLNSGSQSTPFCQSSTDGFFDFGDVFTGCFRFYFFSRLISNCAKVAFLPLCSEGLCWAVLRKSPLRCSRLCRGLLIKAKHRISALCFGNPLLSFFALIGFLLFVGLCLPCRTENGQSR